MQTLTYQSYDIPLDFYATTTVPCPAGQEMGISAKWCLGCEESDQCEHLGDAELAALRYEWHTITFS
jgi:hypothetical protein